MDSGDHEPVHGDAEEVEDGGGGEDHVHGIVHITQHHGEKPVTVKDHLDGIKNHRTHRHRQVWDNEKINLEKLARL